MDIILIVLVLLLIFGGGFGYYNRGTPYGFGGGFGIVGILLVVLVIYLLLGHRL